MLLFRIFVCSLSFVLRLRLIEVCLGKLRDQDPCFRAVVFSQFTSFLDLIQIALEREHFDQYRFDGTMDMKKKAAAINEFKSPSRKPKVLIISLKAGGVGLNVGLMYSSSCTGSSYFAS